MCQTFPILYHCEPHLVCRNSYRFPKHNIQNSVLVHIGNAENILSCKVSNVSIENDWKHSCINLHVCSA